MNIKFYKNYFSDHQIVRISLMETTAPIDEFLL
jgi:hypothetical protein